MSDPNRPEYRVVADYIRENHKGERSRGQQEVGAAWRGKTSDGTEPINVQINAFPRNWDGRITLWPVEANDGGETAA